MRGRPLIVLILSGLLLGACGDGEGPAVDEPADDAATEPAEDAAGDEGTDDAAEEPTDDGVTVEVATSDLGEILVDGEGMTLYLFLPDDAGEPTCTDECLEAWPLLEAPASAGDGVDDDLVGTAEHPSGTTQVTYNDWPLYYFANDASPGDVNGQGVGDNWYVVSPEGEPVQDSG